MVSKAAKFQSLTVRSLAVAVFLCAGVSIADVRTDAIAERIAPVGKVCIAGEECPTAGATAVAGAVSAGAAPAGASEGPRDPETIYQASCNACHAGAIPTSPKFGDAAAWAPRIAKGMDALYHSAMNGTPGGMPPKGACANCSEEEIKAVVDFMVEKAK